METHRSAALLKGQKRYNAAISLLRTITRAHPSMAVVHYQLGLLLGLAGRTDEAVRAFRTAARIEPDNPYIAIAEARLLLRNGRIEDARARTVLAIALAEHHAGPALASAHEVAARVGLALEDADEAETHAAAAETEEETGPIRGFVHGRILFSEGRYEEAREALEAAVAAAGPDRQVPEELHLSLAETLVRLERYPEAEEHFREEMRAFPCDIRAYAGLATLLQALHRTEAAGEILDALVEATRTPEGYRTAARLWTLAGEPMRAAAVKADARAWFRAEPAPPRSAQGARR